MCENSRNTAALIPAVWAYRLQSRGVQNRHHPLLESSGMTKVVVYRWGNFTEWFQGLQWSRKGRLVPKVPDPCGEGYCDVLPGDPGACAVGVLGPVGKPSEAAQVPVALPAQRPSSPGACSSGRGLAPAPCSTSLPETALSTLWPATARREQHAVQCPHD